MVRIMPQETKEVVREYWKDKSVKIRNRTGFPLTFYWTSEGIEVQGLSGLIDITKVQNPSEIKMKEK